MSISRKRVGSVSQRNDLSLPPLDIQSIQMPLNPQNALALKTAALSSTKSLFQMASSLRKRLRNVEDFAGFLDQPPSAQQLDVVSHLCHVFRLGSPLCHLYNLLIPSFITPSSSLYADMPAPAPIRYDFPQFFESVDGVCNWAKRQENAKMCQKYIAVFCMAMKLRREEGRWQGDSWAIHELWGKSTGEDTEAYDSGGLMKVFQTVEDMLDHLPESAMSPASPTPTTPYTNGSSQPFSAVAMSNMRSVSRQSYDMPFSMGGHGPGASAVANMAATMNGGVHLDSDAGPGPSTMAASQSEIAANLNAFKSVEELVNSERTYVQELEILERCSLEILNAELVSPETTFSIFSNLSKILDFQRKFLIKLETEYEPIEEGRGSMAWAYGRWGLPFVEMEKEFECYGPYCANYLDAIKVVNDFMVNLMMGQTLPESDRPCLHPERELQAFMIKPIQRITKYGLLLEAILHATAKHDYPYRSELEDGYAAVRRIAADINETTAFKAKQATVRELVERVDDWKGHDHERFGDLHLDDQFTVSKADSPRDYHVFLFEKMMLCCKEITPDKKSKLAGKNSSMLRKDRTASKGAIVPKPRLALKGRIFVCNITAANVIIPAIPNDPNATPRVQIVWTVPARYGDTDQDFEDSFIMAGRTDDQMRKWSEKVMELAVAARKEQEERIERQRLNGRFSDPQSQQRPQYWAQSSFAPPTPATENSPFAFPPVPPTPNGYGEDDDDFRSGRATPSYSGSSSTVYAPVANRRVQSQQSVSPVNAEPARARAMTEDQNGPSMAQWRQQPPLPRLATNSSGMSSVSESSFGNGSSGGNGFNGGAGVAAIRSGRQLSQSRLGRSEEIDENAEEHMYIPTSSAPAPGPPGAYARYGPPIPARALTRAPSYGVTPSVPYPTPPPLRNRSVSSPNVYQQPQMSPMTPMSPMPNTATHGSSPAWHAYAMAGGPGVAATSSGGGMGGPYPPGPPMSATSSSTGLGSTPGGTAYFNRRMSSGKRSSQDSQSTEMSDFSSQSPTTPYTSTTAGGEMRGSTPVSRQNSSDAGTSISAQPLSATSSHSPTMLVKVRSGESNFVIGLTPDVSYPTLYEKVVKKLRLCSARHANAGIDVAVKIRWLDSDGDEITIKTDADIQTMLLESGNEQIQLIAI